MFNIPYSPETGKSWCSDCTAVEGILSAIFTLNPFGSTSSAAIQSPYGGAASDKPADDGKPKAEVVYVGSREEWRFAPENVYRNPPFEIKKLPTVLKFREGKVVARIEEGQILEGTLLEGFLGA